MPTHEHTAPVLRVASVATPAPPSTAAAAAAAAQAETEAEPRPSLEAMVDDALGPLLEADAAGGSEYVKTLDAYLATDRHLERAAESLHVHPNTVRYRLAKVQEALRVNLRDVDDRFVLELALRVKAALARD